MKQILTIGLTILIIFVGFIQKDKMMTWIHQGGAVAVIICIVFVAILVFFPIIPYPVLAATIGSIFGVFIGVSISLVGVMVGTMIMFILFRYGFQELARKILTKYPTMKEYESFFERNAFVAILYSRLIPIVPSQVVTIVSALSKVKWSTFFVATCIGKIPAAVTFTFAGSVFEGSKRLSISIFVLYFLILMLTASIHI